MNRGSETRCTYLNFSNEGSLVTDLNYFVNSVEKLESIAQHQFEKTILVETGQSMSDFFKEGQFIFPADFGFDRGGLQVPYDPSLLMADTSFIMVIPFMELKGIYKHKI